MNTVESWSGGARFLSTGWLVAWILGGSYLLFEHQPFVGAA